ncbi:putative RNA-directed DNA polymerase, eukaryota, reverse transcriptase zinc-binding domain protein, partial [Tanacetum coccineum]
PCLALNVQQLSFGACSRFYNGVISCYSASIVKPDDNNELEKSVDVEEIRTAVWDCGSQKASGVDGFSFLFLKRYWEFLKDDVVEAVRSAFDSFVMPKGVQYKGIAKILANRLAKVVNKVIGHEQSAFISGRQILDGPIMLSEVMSWFGDKWRRWIQMCLHSARSSVLVNRSPSREFSIKRGLRQDDPLSPFLFIIVMEGLHLALKDAVDTSLICGTNMGDTSYNISHLFYADDIVIISDWNKQDMDNIIRILQVFYLASGLKLNISKSQVYGLGVSSNDIEDMTRDTGCTTGNIPFSYLGLPIGSNMNSIDNWQPTAIHGVDAGLDLKGCSCSGIWSSIISTYSMLNAHDIIPSYTLHHKVGDDSNANCVISDRIINNTWAWNWNRESKGSRNEAALEVMVSELGQVCLSNLPDAWSWNISDDGNFSVQATIIHIDNCLLPSLSPSTRWSKLLPRLDSNDHVFFGCDTASKIWRLIRVWTDINMPSFSSWFDWFQWIDDWRASKDSKDSVYVISAASLWVL